MNGPITRRAFLGYAASAGALSFMTDTTESAAMATPTTSPKLALSRFSIRVTDATLARLTDRVRSARFPKTSKGAGWRYGVDALWFKELIDYWSDGFDWRSAEERLNRTEQFLVPIDGRDVHLARLVPKISGSKRPPLLLLHGWPYSFATMLPLAETLASDGFEVIVPSLPGFAFSAAPDDQVRGLRFISRRIDRLMTEALGHSRYLVHGGDHGAVVADWLAIDTPDHLIGIHANMIAFRHAGANYGSGQTGVSDATPEEMAYVKAEVENMDRESAYFRLQLTRPETVTYALTDSPVGWAAYMLDKWQKWTDTREQPFQSIYHRDRLLTEVMLFVVTDSAATSIWPYAGFATEPFGLEPGQKIAVPFGYSSFADPLLPRIPKHFVQRSRTDIRLWREHDRGGHFPMLEETEALAHDIVAFAELVS
jgi:pimeloyl-ACP methyl ester carboxylesterase